MQQSIFSMMHTNDVRKLPYYYCSVLANTVSKRYPLCFKADKISSFMLIPFFLTVNFS